MKKNEYKVLIITDHKNHTIQNSLYDLSVKMHLHYKVSRVDVATRNNASNDDFFSCKSGSDLWATTVTNKFAYSENVNPLDSDFHKISLDDYSLIWLRLPPPIGDDFLKYLSLLCKYQIIINNPNGIRITGSKSYLLNFPMCCPPMKICRSTEDILEFKEKFPIVLKPYRGYGGQGIIKVEGDFVWKGIEKIPFTQFINEISNNEIEYLAVKYLKNIGQGDKRIVVVNGEVLGASLRLPQKDSWICNVAMGGSSNMAEITKEELEIVKIINPPLVEMGVVMYGIDTLVNDDGLRVLSEINTTSIGGLPQIAKLRNEPLVDRAIVLIINYLEAQQKNI